MKERLMKARGQYGIILDYRGKGIKAGCGERWNTKYPTIIPSVPSSKIGTCIFNTDSMYTVRKRTKRVYEKGGNYNTASRQMLMRERERERAL